MGSSDVSNRESGRASCGWRSFSTRELELLDGIAEGKSTFDRERSPDLDEVDTWLQSFAELGYVGKLVRTVDAGEERPRRVDVIGGLTPLGQLRRRQLLAGLERTAA